MTAVDGFGFAGIQETPAMNNKCKRTRKQGVPCPRLAKESFGQGGSNIGSYQLVLRDQYVFVWPRHFVRRPGGIALRRLLGEI